jgi:hypothetical protein
LIRRPASSLFPDLEHVVNGIRIQCIKDGFNLVGILVFVADNGVFDQKGLIIIVGYDYIRAR